MSRHVENAKLDSGNDGNEVIITVTVTLTEEEAQDYIELDEILRCQRADEFDDLMLDMGWSYVDDVLVTVTWESLSRMLQLVKDIAVIRHE